MSATGGVLGAIAFTTAMSPSSPLADKASAKSEAAAETGAVSERQSHRGGFLRHRAADSLKTTALQYEVRQAEAKATDRALDGGPEEGRRRRTQGRGAGEGGATTRLPAPRRRTDLSSGSGNVSSVISFLKAQVGKSYVLGASGPSSYDCSGLTQAAFKQVGVEPPAYLPGPSPSRARPSPWTRSRRATSSTGAAAGSAYHIGVYVGGGKFIGAQNSSTGVVEKTLELRPAVRRGPRAVSDLDVPGTPHASQRADAAPPSAPHGAPCTATRPPASVFSGGPLRGRRNSEERCTYGRCSPAAARRLRARERPC